MFDDLKTLLMLKEFSYVVTYLMDNGTRKKKLNNQRHRIVVVRHIFSLLHSRSCAFYRYE